jgi:UDP-2,4-diacetamido-2,4,6-trideoxy-beta-L-altropyranose hydrolase
MSNKIYIRADGGNKIGLGHLVRCFALALMLKDDFEITFVSLQIPNDIKNEINSNGYSSVTINSEDDFLKLLSPFDVVILDHYGLNSNYQKQIKKIGCKLVCVDDLHDKKFYADLIINHTPGISPSDYQAQSYTQFALGLDFALLRPGFLEKARVNKKIEKIKTLFICFGGSDFNNLTAITLKVALEFQAIKKIIIVTGSAFELNEEIQIMKDNNPKTEWFFGISENKMLELLERSDLAIVPSSGILLEVLSVGCKVISGMIVENQKYALNALVFHNAIINAETFSESAIRKAIFVALNSKSDFTKIIDGNQKSRIVDKIKSIVQRVN